MNNQVLRNLVANDDAVRLGFAPSVLRTARQDAGLSVSDLASMVGVRDRTVERWERGDMRPKSEALARIERVLAELAAA